MRTDKKGKKRNTSENTETGERQGFWFHSRPDMQLDRQWYMQELESIVKRARSPGEVKLY